MAQACQSSESWFSLNNVKTAGDSDKTVEEAHIKRIVNLTRKQEVS